MKKWEVLNKLKAKNIIDVLLKNRALKTEREKKEFLNPTTLENISLKSLKISETEIKKAINRVRKAVKAKEQIIIYGDYDADGVCATAIMWETLYSLNKKTLPYIPGRFNEGYGLNARSVENIKSQNPNLKLIITVDNGIVAYDGVKKANELGIDVIITDHHQKGNKLPKVFATIHTTEIGGAGVSWIFSREILKSLKIRNWKLKIENGLDLCAIGTISDQLSLLGPNRSFAKYGLEVLSNTKRTGLLALFDDAKVGRESGDWQVGTYEVNYVIAPRLNAMGRLEHAIDSLRLLCTNSRVRARELAGLLGKTNLKRQKVVDEVLLHAINRVGDKEKIIILAHESYHEGVIGLAASKLVERFYRPAIVVSKGEKYSKASARSISGFNIIEVLRNVKNGWIEGGGHPMAAGFTLETEKIELFSRELNKLAKPLLTDEVLQRKLKIDLEMDFGPVNWELFEDMKKFEPTGIGNPTPSFVTRKIELLEARLVGRESKHIKLVLRKGGIVFGAIYFGGGELFPQLVSGVRVDAVYTLSENIWNGERKLELRIKDLRPLAK